MTKGWLIPLVFFGLGSGLVCRGQDGAVGEKLQAVRTRLQALYHIGAPIFRPVGRYRSQSKVLAARPVFRLLRKQLRELPALQPVPKRSKLESLSVSFGKTVDALIAEGGAALPVVERVLPQCQGLEKQALEAIRLALVCHEAFKVIDTYIVDGREQGSFDGMFKGMRRFGDLAPLAFLQIFCLRTRATAVRSLAGEAVAQLSSPGDKRIMDALRRLMKSNLTKEAIRKRARWVLARLGDDAILQSLLKQSAEDIEKLKPQVAQLGKELKLATDKLREAEGAESDEDKAALRDLRKRRDQINLQYLGTRWALGASLSGRAWIYMQLRMHKEAEPVLKETLKHQIPVASHARQPQRAEVGNSYYNLACTQACQGKTQKALASLENAFRWGFKATKWARRDGDLRKLWTSKGFQTLLDEIDSGERQKKWRKEREEAQKKSPSGTPTSKPTSRPSSRVSGD